MFEDCSNGESNLIKNNICPDCRQVGFLEGPHGGLAVNIMCANPNCGSKFNWTPFGAERISEKSPANKLPT